MDPLADLTRLEGVASAMASARDGIDVLLRDRGLRRTTPDVTGESLLRGACASAGLAGSTSREADIREGRGDAVAQASVRISTHLLGLSSVLARSPLQAFARLHAVAAADEVAEARSPGADTGSEPGTDLVGRPRDAESARRLQELAAMLARPTEAPGLVVAAVAHAEIRTARPFANHNGLVARAVERLVLVQRSVDPVSATVPEAGHEAARGAYESRLEGYAEGGRAGVHAWLLYAAEAYAAGVERSPLLR